MGVQVHHRYTTVNGRQLFYREAGHPDAPALVLLHGFPTSSFMFRDLIPRLGDHYHVIAPDHLGFGLSDAPSVEEFDYTFDALTDLTEGLLDQLGVSRYAIYVQDYGAPIGWRLALRRPQAITAIVTQNGNGYDEGFVDSFWTTVWDYQREQTPNTEAAVRTALDVDGIRWQYLTGVSDDSLVSPDAWLHDAAMVGRPGNDADPAQAVPRLRDQRADVPGAARLPTHQQGAGARRLGRGRSDLRARRRPRVRKGRTGRRDPPSRRRPLPAGNRGRRGLRIDAQLPAPGNGGLTAAEWTRMRGHHNGIGMATRPTGGRVDRALPDLTTATRTPALRRTAAPTDAGATRRRLDRRQ